MPSPEAVAAAGALARQYGEDAASIAVLTAAEAAAMGDREKLAFWDEVIALLGGENSGSALN